MELGRVNHHVEQVTEILYAVRSKKITKGVKQVTEILYPDEFTEILYPDELISVVVDISSVEILSVCFTMNDHKQALAVNLLTKFYLNGAFPLSC